MKSSKDDAQKDSERQIDQNLVSALKKLLVYDRHTFGNISIAYLRSPLENQVRKFYHNSKLSNNQLMMVVLNNHVRAIMDIWELNSVMSQRSEGSMSGRRSFKEQNSVQTYQEISQEFFDSDQQLNRLIILNNDFEKAQGLLETAIKTYTGRNFRHKRNKIIQSRVRVLELLLSLIRYIEIKHDSGENVPQLPGFASKIKNSSYQELEINHVRIIVEELDDKVGELSTICEQIPQLQAYKRTLDLTMPQHNVSLKKIVDVLIELHHRVNKLLSRNPQKLLKEIQAVERQCEIIEVASFEFLSLIESENDVQIKPIYFNQKKNKSPDYFRRIQKNIVKMSQHLLAALATEAEVGEKIIKMKGLIQIFWNIISGMDEYQREWRIQKNRNDLSIDEQQIIQILEDCLKIVKQYQDDFETLKEQFEHYVKMENQHGSNVEYLQLQIHKLSKQYEETKILNEELEQDRDRIKQELLELKKKHHDLSRKYQVELLDTKNKGISQKKQKAYLNKIQALEAENQQKKIMLNNLSNDLKRVMRESQNSQKIQQKIKDLKDKFERLSLENEQLQKKLKQEKYDKQVLKKNNLLLENNNNILLKKLDEANLQIQQLLQEKSQLTFKFNLEINGLKNQLNLSEQRNQQFLKRIKQIEENMNQMSQFTISDKQNLQKQFKQNSNKKDQKISQLNSKIIELNKKLNKMVDDYKSMEFQIKKRDQIQRDLTLKIKEIQFKVKEENNEKMKQTQKKDSQINSLLAELDRSHQFANQLQTQLNKRQKIIEDLQAVIKQLEGKISARYQQEQNFVAETNKGNYLHNQDIERHSKELEVTLRTFEEKEKELERKNQELESKLKFSSERIGQLEREVLDIEKKLTAQFKNKQTDYLTRIKNLQNQVFALEERIREMDQQIVKLRNSAHTHHQSHELENTIKTYQTEITEKNEIIIDLEGVVENFQEELSTKNSLLNNLESVIEKIQEELSKKNSLIKNLQHKLKEYEKNKKNQSGHDSLINNLESKLKEYENKFSEQGNLMKNLQNKLKEFEKNEKNQSGHGSLIKSLESKLKEYENKFSEQGNLMKNLESKIKGLQYELTSKNNRITELQSENKTIKLTLQTKNKQISDKNMQLTQLSNKNKQLQSKHLFQNSTTTASTKYIDQIEYLKQKVWSLQDLVEVLRQQNNIFEQTIKQQRGKSLKNQESRSYSEISVTESVKYKKQIESRDLLIEILQKKLKSKLDQAHISDSSILKSKQSNLQASSDRRKLQSVQEELKSLQANYRNVEIIHQTQAKTWKQQENKYLLEINKYKNQIQSLMRNNGNKHKQTSYDQYYLRAEGKKLEELVTRMEMGSYNLNLKVDQIFTNNRKIENSKEIIDNPTLKELYNANMELITQVRNILQQKEQLTQIVKQYPNPSYLTEFVFKIILYFSQLHPQSEEGRLIWNQLINIRQNNQGGHYFVVLEQFTKYSLEENAIEVYRRQLKQKAEQLQILKAKLDIFFRQKIRSEERVYNNSVLSESRSKLFREKYKGYQNMSASSIKKPHYKSFIELSTP